MMFVWFFFSCTLVHNYHKKAAFLILVVMVGFQRSFGIFFIEIRQRYNVSASLTSAVGGIATGCSSITGTVFCMYSRALLCFRICFGLFLIPHLHIAL